MGLRFPEIYTANGRMGTTWQGGNIINVPAGVEFQLGDVKFNTSNFDLAYTLTGTNGYMLRFTLTGEQINSGSSFWSYPNSEVPTGPGQFYLVEWDGVGVSNDIDEMLGSEWDSTPTDMHVGTWCASIIPTGGVGGWHDLENRETLRFIADNFTPTPTSEDISGNWAGHFNIQDLDWARTPQWNGYISQRRKGHGFWNDAIFLGHRAVGDDCITQSTTLTKPAQPYEVFHRLAMRLACIESYNGSFGTTRTLYNGGWTMLYNFELYA